MADYGVPYQPSLFLAGNQVLKAPENPEVLGGEAGTSSLPDLEAWSMDKEQPQSSSSSSGGGNAGFLGGHLSLGAFIGIIVGAAGEVRG
jgi:hypothetical protein